MVTRHWLTGPLLLRIIEVGVLPAESNCCYLFMNRELCALAIIERGRALSIALSLKGPTVTADHGAISWVPSSQPSACAELSPLGAPRVLTSSA